MQSFQDTQSYDITRTFHKYQTKKQKNKFIIEKLLRLVEVPEIQENIDLWQTFLEYEKEDHEKFLDLLLARPYTKEQIKKEFFTKLNADRYYKLSTRIDSCSDFATMAQCEDCGSNHFVGTKSCKSRFCRVCASKRSLLYLHKYGQILQDHEDMGYNLYFLTFTLKSMWNLDDMLNRFNKTMVRFREDYPIFKNYFDGGLVSREITFNPTEGWHVHIHMICLSKRDMSAGEMIQYNQDLSKAWLQKTQDSYITDCRRVKKKKIGDKVFNTHLLELCKYITDLNDLMTLTDNEFKTVIDTLHRRRLISAFGVLYNYQPQVEQEIENELDDCSFNKLIDSCCAVCGCDRLTLMNFYSLTYDGKVYRLKEKL